MSQQIIEITIGDLLNNVVKYKQDGYKLIQMCATKTPDGFELSYSFAIKEDFQTLRFNISEDTEVSSISEIFAPAFLYENEMKDLFGVKIANISVDYKGSFYRTSVKTPFNTNSKEI